jgi:proteasome assembly chaperone (PAC2) family protein
MSALQWKEPPPQLREPLLIYAFRGWNDAGEAASAAVGLLVANLEARLVAEVDPEEFFDFTAVRPTIRLTEGMSRVIEWPATSIHVAEVPAAERDLVLVQGVEPSLRWRAFADTVTEAAEKLGARMAVALGALLADVPHTRPIAITGLASDEALVDRMGFGGSNYEGPTGIVGILHSAFTARRLPSVSLWASVPHYVAAATPNPSAALELVRRVEGIAGVAVDAGELEDAAVEYERQVNAAVASDPDVKAFVERLEAEADEHPGADPTPRNLPSGDTLARDFQRYLRQQED